MQLISLSLLMLSLLILGGAVLFIVWWHRAYNRSSVVQMLHEGIGHIGISVVVEYPETQAPLLALLEEKYPQSEAIIITDLQQSFSLFGSLIPQFHLVRVNHSHLIGVRALYRSRYRAFRRVVMVDLPIAQRHNSSNTGKAVAVYDYVLHLQGESVVAHNAISYCANIIASQGFVEDMSLRSLVGADARLERGDLSTDKRRVISLRSHRALAWQRESLWFSILAMLLPAVMVFAAHLLGSRIALFAAFVTAIAIIIFLYVSCRVEAKKSLFVTLNAILRNFYCLVVERMKYFHSLYKKGVSRNPIFAKGVAIIDRRRKNNRKSL